MGGNLEELYKRVGAVNSKSGPFDCLFCTGEFFGSADVGGERLPDSLKIAPHNTHDSTLQEGRKDSPAADIFHLRQGGVCFIVDVCAGICVCEHFAVVNRCKKVLDCLGCDPVRFAAAHF